MLIFCESMFIARILRTAIEISAEDKIEIINVEGKQTCEVIVFNSKGKCDLSILNLKEKNSILAKQNLQQYLMRIVQQAKK